MRPEKDRKTDKDYDYKNEHIEIYDTMGKSWPPELSQEDLCDFFASIQKRRAELIYVLHTFFPIRTKGFENAEFIDSNEALGRLVGWNKGGNKPGWSPKNPWQQTLHTMTGHSF